MALDPAKREPSIPLYDFFKAAWPIVEPGMAYLDNWHVGAIADHLEAVSRGDIQNLLINIPPGHAKSILVSALWPAWIWSWWPEWRGLFSSYDLSLVTRDAIRMRDTITSDWYKAEFSPTWRLKSDQNVKTLFKNTRQGFRFCHTVAGRGTGHRGDAIVVDDPLNAKERNSEVKREAATDWWKRTMPTRLNDPRTGVRVVIMQRLHELDLSGVILEEGGFEHLCLMTFFEPERRSKTYTFDTAGQKNLFFEDPRTEPDELLFPELFTEPVLEKLKKVLGDADFAGQHQQLPRPKDGTAFLRAWFQDNLVDAAPLDADYIRYWDKAASTKKGADWTAGVLMCRCRATGLFYVVDVIRGKWSPSEREAHIRSTAMADAAKYGHVHTRLEREGGSSGIDSALMSVSNLVGFSVDTEHPTGEKSVRFDPVASQARVGNVKFVKGGWNSDYVEELTGLWSGSHDDQADATSGAFNFLARLAWGNDWFVA